MKLNPDCTRDLLLAIESVTTLSQGFDYKVHAKELLSKYSEDEIKYHARQCSLSNLVYKYGTDLNNDFYVQDLTPEGHAFLANIRDDNTYKKVKSISEKIGVKSLSAIVQIATNVVSEMINAQF